MSHGSTVLPSTLHVVPLRSDQFASLLRCKPASSQLARLGSPADQLAHPVRVHQVPRVL